jgi:hypothetical protein
MKNIKGYYSWIHSLNEAAIQSQQKGFEMLKEEKARRITDPQRQAALSGQMQPPAPRTMPGDDVLPIYGEAGQQLDAARASDLKAAMAAEIQDKMKSGVRGYEKVTPTSVSLAGGDPGAYVEIARMKRAELAAKRARATGPVDAAPTGDADDVAMDAEDGEMADPGIGDPSSPLPTYSLAAQARSDHARELYKEASRAARIAARQAAAEEDYEEREDARRLSGPTGRTGETYNESVNKKINKLLNEKIEDEEGDAESEISNIRGTANVGGEQSIFAAGTYPGGIFNKIKGPRTESAQIKHLIKIVSNPENHPPEHVKYADEFLKAMASHLRGRS